MKDFKLTLHAPDLNVHHIDYTTDTGVEAVAAIHGNPEFAKHVDTALKRAASEVTEPNVCVERDVGGLRAERDKFREALTELTYKNEQNVCELEAYRAGSISAERDGALKRAERLRVDYDLLRDKLQRAEHTLREAGFTDNNDPLWTPPTINDTQLIYTKHAGIYQCGRVLFSDTETTLVRFDDETVMLRPESLELISETVFDVLQRLKAKGISQSNIDLTAQSLTLLEDNGASVNIHD